MASAFAQDANQISESQPFVVYPKGKPAVKGVAVRYHSGAIMLKTSSTGGELRFRSDQVVKIVSPTHRYVSGIRDFINAGKYKDAVKIMKTAAGKEVLRQQEYLGWGKRIAFYYAYALIKTGEKGEVNNILRNTRGFVPGSDDALDRQLIKICQAALESSNKKFGAAKSILKAEVEKLQPEVKPYFYNIEGDIFYAEKKPQEAVLSYYKTFLLDRTNAMERGYAKAKITQVYRDTNDPRASVIGKLR